MSELQDVATIKYILWLAGGLVTLLLTIVGFFIARIVSDVKNNTLEIGKNKGKIDLVDQQQKNDIARVEQTTQLELQQLTKQVGGLADSVNTLVQIQMKN